ncbi:MAG: hypothetical protein J6Y80_05325, partial [Victivallales bacterium]|nr:hypothetical protein [Victivallales bacterium]
FWGLDLLQCSFYNNNRHMKITAALETLLALSFGTFLAFGEGISLNQDSDNFFARYTDVERDLTVRGLQSLPAIYCQGQSREVIFDGNSQKVSYETHTRFDSLWTDCEFLEDGVVLYKGSPLAEGFARIARSAKRLHDAGINPYTVWFDYVRAKGYSPWISMRMNDMHGSRPEDYLTNNFWSEHPELRYGEGGYGFDFAQPEVRKYSFELIHEYLTLFDVDGIEIDWSRFMVMLRTGHELEDAHCLT